MIAIGKEDVPGLDITVDNLMFMREVEGIGNVELELVWDPPWNPDMMSEAAKLTLNF